MSEPQSNPSSEKEARQIVLGEYPDAAIRTCTSSWTTIYSGHRPLGKGITPAAAWKDAARKVQEALS